MSRQQRRAAARANRSQTRQRRAFPVTAAHSYATTLAPEETVTTDESAELPRYWSGIIGMEGVLTGDGRLIENGALEWETPVPIRFVKEDTGGHQGAVVSGRILGIMREDGGVIRGYGDFDHGSEEGREAARLVGAELMNGVSIDLDAVGIEIRVAREILEEEQQVDEEGVATAAEDNPVDEEGRVTVISIAPDDKVMVTTTARIRGATQVSIPAFAEAMIYAVDELPSEIMALVASAAPVDPPAEWFRNPELSGPTALTITDDGRVFGHLATFDVCHLADPNGSGVCVRAPKSASGYAYFHTGVVKTKEGELAPTGVLRFNTQHASLSASAESATAHYDHTGLAGADVHVGEDQYGIWVAGALRPGLTDEQVRTLRASPLSGDWRYIGGSLELVGALAVNLPGFPIPRTSGMVASGELTGLVAAGMVATPESVKAARLHGQLSATDLSYLERMIDRERRNEVRSLHARANAAMNRRKVEQMAAKLKTTATV